MNNRQADSLRAGHHRMSDHQSHTVKPTTPAFLFPAFPTAFETGRLTNASSFDRFISAAAVSGSSVIHRPQVSKVPPTSDRKRAAPFSLHGRWIRRNSSTFSDVSASTNSSEWCR
jgi:hypothetical protein